MIENQSEPKKSSARRIAAFRANGAKCRGPVTADGKARSSKNAATHGLASAAIVLTTEDWPNYLACREAYIRRFQPADQIELDLVEDMVAARWRMQRMWALESAALDDEIDAQRAKVYQNYSAILPTSAPPWPSPSWPTSPALSPSSAATNPATRASSIEL